MALYFYRGRYSAELQSHVLANAREFQATMKSSVEAFSGRVERCLLTVGSVDPIGFVEFPDDATAAAWATFYRQQKGVLLSEIEPLLSDDDLAQVAKLIEGCGPKAVAHRKAAA